MRLRYKVIGPKQEGNEVRMFLQRCELIQNKEQFNPEEMLSDMMGTLQKVQGMAMQMQVPDMLTIPYEEWKKYKWNIGDIILVNVTPEKE